MNTPHSPAAPVGQNGLDCHNGPASSIVNDASRSRTHLLVIPTYNTGNRVIETVREAHRYWSPVWVVVDGSTDGTCELLQALAQNDPGIRVLALPYNAGKARRYCMHYARRRRPATVTRW